MNVIYCFDAYCSWCYGFSNVIRALKEQFSEYFNFEILSGGMILPEDATPISAMAEPWLNGYKRIEEMTGAKFGDDFLWHLKNADQSDWFPNSEKPAIALSVVKDMKNDIAFDFALDMEYGLFYEGRDLTDNEAYRHLLEKYAIDTDEFYEKLSSETYMEKARYDFSLVKQLKVEGYPAVLIQVSVDKFYLMANGYTDLATMQERFKNVLAELNN